MMAHRAPGALERAPGGRLTDARLVAADVLADLRRGELLDGSFDRRVETLEARDRRWVQELVYGMLRRRGWIDHLLGPRVRGGLVRLDADLADVLRLGVYQLFYMDSVPAYAAIGQTVELAKRRHGLGASKLANAVLRRLDREPPSRDRADDDALAAGDPIEAMAIRLSHPAWLIARWVAEWGMDETERLLVWNNEEPPLVVRPYGVVREQLEASLERSGVKTLDVPLVSDSIRLVPPVSLTELGAFRQGQLFVQDPAATLVVRYAAFPAGGVVVDLCAAPGGKSIEMSRHAPVVAADRSVLRLERMRANLARLDVRNVVLSAMDARAPALSDVSSVLLDVPCTATGTFRRHPDARWRLRLSDVAILAATQRSMLAAAAGVVRRGGILVYSTCSLEPEENDAVVDAFLEAHPTWMLEPPPAGTVPGETLVRGRLRVLPHRHGTDGAFAARLVRVA